MNQMNTLQANMATLRDALEKNLPNIKAVAASHLNPDRIIKVVLGSASRTPRILECTPISVVKSVLQGAELGLEPGSVTGEYYLVPYKNGKTGRYEAQGIPGYKGLITLARRTGELSTIYAEAVFQGDVFECELGLEPKLRHVPNWETQEREAPNKLLFVYAVCVFKDGGKQFVVMTRSQVEGIRARSKAANNGPWVTDYVEMAKKTGIRRLAKYLPMSAQLARALELQAQAEAGDFDSPVVLEGEAIPAEEGSTPPTQAPSGGQRLRNALQGPQETRDGSGATTTPPPPLPPAGGVPPAQDAALPTRQDEEELPWED